MKSVYIKLEDALRIVEQVITSGNIKHTGKAIRKRLKELPAEDVERVKHGEWLSNAVSDEYVCSECDGIAPVDCEKEDFYESNYCPNCGAKMDKEEGAEE